MGGGYNTAKAVMKLLGEAKSEDGKECYGEEAWKAMGEEMKSFVIDICASHSRNYPADEFNGLFSRMRNDTLGDEFDECAQKAGSRSKLEKEVPHFCVAFASWHIQDLASTKRVTAKTSNFGWRTITQILYCIQWEG